MRKLIARFFFGREKTKNLHPDMELISRTINNHLMIETFLDKMSGRKRSINDVYRESVYPKLVKNRTGVPTSIHEIYQPTELSELTDEIDCIATNSLQIHNAHECQPKKRMKKTVASKAKEEKQIDAVREKWPEDFSTLQAEWKKMSATTPSRKINLAVICFIYKGIREKLDQKNDEQRRLSLLSDNPVEQHKGIITKRIMDVIGSNGKSGVSLQFIFTTSILARERVAMIQKKEILRHFNKTLAEKYNIPKSKNEAWTHVLSFGDGIQYLGDLYNVWANNTDVIPSWTTLRQLNVPKAKILASVFTAEKLALI